VFEQRAQEGGFTRPDSARDADGRHGSFIST
jgi:hypothetical protein